MKNWFVKMAVHVGISQMEVQNAFVLVDIAVFNANIPLVKLIRVMRPVICSIRLCNIHKNVRALDMLNILML